MGIEVISGQPSFQSAPAPIAVEAPAVNVQVASSQPQGNGSLGSVTSVGMKPFSSSQEKGQIKTESGEQPTADEIKSAINQANRRAKFGHANAEFSYHEETKRISIKIVDQDTNEVIREIPPEETLDMISKMWELAGIIVDEKR